MKILVRKGREGHSISFGEVIWRSRGFAIQESSVSASIFKDEDTIENHPRLSSALGIEKYDLVDFEIRK